MDPHQIQHAAEQKAVSQAAHDGYELWQKGLYFIPACGMLIAFHSDTENVIDSLLAPHPKVG